MINTFDVILFGYTPAQNPETVSHTLAMKWAFYVSLALNSLCLIFIPPGIFLITNFASSICIMLICCIVAVIYFFRFSNLQMNRFFSVPDFLKNIFAFTLVFIAFSVSIYAPIIGLEPDIHYAGDGMTGKNFLIFVLINSYFFSGFLSRCLSMFIFNMLQFLKR